MNSIQFKKRKYFLLILLSLIAVIIVRFLMQGVFYFKQKHYHEIIVPLENTIDIITPGRKRTIIRVKNQGNISSYLSGITTEEILSGSYTYSLIYNGWLLPGIYSERKNLFNNKNKNKLGVIRIYESGFQELDSIIIDGNIFLKKERHFIETLY